jgi:hypothetical protein
VGRKIVKIFIGSKIISNPKNIMSFLNGPQLDYIGPKRAWSLVGDPHRAHCYSEWPPSCMLICTGGSSRSKDGNRFGSDWVDQKSDPRWNRVGSKNAPAPTGENSNPHLHLSCFGCPIGLYMGWPNLAQPKWICPNAP